MSKIRQPKVLTQEELDKEAEDAEKAARAELEKAEVTPVPAAEVKPTEPEPTKVEPSKEETPVEVTPAKVEKNDVEIEALKTTMAEKESRIAELTKRLRDEDGKRGGDLAALREQQTKLGDQIRELIAENRELRKQPAQPVQPEDPDVLAEQYPEVAKGMEKRTKPAIEAATRAEQSAKEIREELAQVKKTQYERDFSSFVTRIKTAVPKLDSYNVDPKFEEWCRGKNPGSIQTRQEVFNLCSQYFDDGPAIQLYQQWENENKPATPTQSTEQPKGPVKPTKEAQIPVPSATESVPKAKPVVASSRIKELEDKLYKFGTATKDDRLEYERLLDERERVVA
jgi:hypothetical protein